MPTTPKPRTSRDKRKPEAVIRELRSRLTREHGDHNQTLAQAIAYRSRATKAEQESAALRSEIANWERRFDALLAAVPELRTKAEPDDDGACDGCNERIPQDRQTREHGGQRRLLCEGCAAAEGIVRS